MKKNEENQTISETNNNDNYQQSYLTRNVNSMIQLVIWSDKRRYKLKLQLLFPYYVYKRHLNIQVGWPLSKSPESYEIPSSESTFLIPFFFLPEYDRKLFLFLADQIDNYLFKIIVTTIYLFMYTDAYITCKLMSVHMYVRWATAMMQGTSRKESEQSVIVKVLKLYSRSSVI